MFYFDGAKYYLNYGSNHFYHVIDVDSNTVVISTWFNYECKNDGTCRGVEQELTP